MLLYQKGIAIVLQLPNVIIMLGILFTRSHLKGGEVETEGGRGKYNNVPETGTWFVDIVPSS